MREITVKNQFNNDITISLIGTFKIDALNKEFIIYSLTDTIEENPVEEVVEASETAETTESTEEVSE